MWQVVTLMMLGQVAGPVAPAEPQLPPLTPADAIAAAHADLAKLPAAIQPHVRYMSLYSTPPADRLRVRQVLNGHCNGLSREPDLTPVAIVPGSQAALVRVVLRDYSWSAATWEKLVDPYFSAAVETSYEDPWEGGTWPGDGKYYKPNTFTVRRVIKTQALAPWLTETPDTQKKLADVVAWTQSKMPVVRADWFMNQTAAAADRSPNYYDFIGVKNEKDFQRLVGVDVALAESRKSVHREAVAVSGVALKARAIIRLGAIDGGYWKTLDFKTNLDAKNPLRVLGKEIEDGFDATEQIASLPNGMLAYFLGNAKGEAQAAAPDNIASDSSSLSNDRRVHANVSCIRCHSNGGLQDVDGWVKNLLTAPLDLRSPDYEKYRELRREYARDMQEKIKHDRALYETAVKQATGLDSQEYSAAYSALWESYENATVDLTRAAADLGVTVEKLRGAIERQVKANYGNTVMSVLLLDNPRINRIPIRVWEDEYPNAQLLLKGLVQP